MYRNKIAPSWIFFLLWTFIVLSIPSSNAAAASRSLVLVMGDVESRPAVLAVRTLQAELRTLNVVIRIIPASAASADRNALANADVAVVNVLGQQAMQAISTELQTLQQNGKPVLAVGNPADHSLQALGVREDKTVLAYHRAGGPENMANMLRHVLRAYFGALMDIAPVRAMPEAGLYDVQANQVRAGFDDYLRNYANHREGAPWIGIMFYRASLVSGQTLPLAAIVTKLEQAGYNVLPAFGYPYEVPLRYFLDEQQHSRIDALVALGMKVGGTASTGAILDKLGVPAINAITLSQHTAAQWEASKVGLDIIERTWQLAGAELAGLIQPTVVASRERMTDEQTGLSYVEERPITDRVQRLRERIDAWLALRRSDNAGKRIALLYFNYPHGAETIGAAYLNVLPESLWQIAKRMGEVGYRLSDDHSSLPSDKMALQTDIQRWGSYPGKDARQYRDGLVRLAESGQALLVPLSDYRRWYDDLPASLRGAVEKAWGRPEQASTLWRDAHGQRQFVFPARRYGNLLMAPQPTRAWEQNLEKLHNEVTLPPGHEYIAFYLWLQHAYKANAVIHLGTHGTHEWLTGKEAGLSNSDPTEALIGAMPNIYPYVMDDVGEGLQAKRRGMATIIDHMTPPFDSAGLNPDLRELGALLNDYRVAGQKSPILARSHLAALNRLAAKAGVLKDMGLTTLQSEADMEALEEYLDNIGSRLTPFGLHTFGIAPAPEQRNATARAVTSMDAGLSAADQVSRIERLEQSIVDSAALELERLMLALDGHYIPAGPGADLIRNPAALPTGRNFYGLDPSRIPSRSTYEQGETLARQLVEDYRSRHGVYPDKLTVNLWGVETSRHEGIMEAQVMALLGVRPTWDERGRVNGVEAISRQQLGRPRVDVTMVSSGLFRDLFANVLVLLDQAALLAQQQGEQDNALRAHNARTVAYLRQRGVSQDDAVRLAGTRIFGLPSGAYGTNIEKLIPLTNAWQNESEVAEVFINRMSHPFGEGNRDSDAGQGSNAALPADLRRDLFRRALSGSRIALHSRSSNLFATLDNDDFFQYLGGTALAIRSIDARTPEVMVTDLSNPRKPQHATLGRYMGQELQSRYLNPRWADAMLNEGYAGARHINRVVDYLWAWQVTVPEVVDATKWQRMFETYVADRHGLRVRERIARSGNLLAYQAMTDRMLTAIEKAYWKPDPKVRAKLERENKSAMEDAGVACSDASCSRTTLAQASMFRQAPLPREAPYPTDQPGSKPSIEARAPSQAAVRSTSPSLPPSGQPTKLQAPQANSQAAASDVSGFEMQPISHMSATQKTIGSLALFLVAIVLFGIGYMKRRP
jgi:cobaltochelatase CobN